MTRLLRTGWPAGGLYMGRLLRNILQQQIQDLNDLGRDLSSVWNLII